MQSNKLDGKEIIMLEHPEITWIQRTGYPSWMQEPRQEPGDDEWEEDTVWLHRCLPGSGITANARS